VADPPIGPPHEAEHRPTPRVGVSASAQPFGCADACSFATGGCAPPGTAPIAGPIGGGSSVGTDLYGSGMPGAAFFDLDRTLLRGASAPVIGRALNAAGVTDRSMPGEQVLMKIYDLFGENRPSMEVTKRAVRFASGWVREQVQEAGEQAAEALAAMVQPFAGPIFDEHRAAGRPLVLATTTPYDLIKPLADALGFDAVLATRYATGADGKYDGTFDGEFVWGPGKLRAITAWAQERGVELAESWAYSDSYYDLPMLGAVGHPVAVNPDPRLVGMALVRRWPILHLDVPAGVPKIPVLGIEPQRAALVLVRPELIPYARFDISGVDNLPTEGPAIVVGNHRSYFDPLAMAVVLAKRGRPVRFLGKKEVFDAPVVGQIAKAMGGIRVERGTGSDEPLAEAAAALMAGEVVALMPEGTIPRGKAFFKTTLKGRWGAARLAEMTGAPVIPVGLWGTEKVWPRSERLPNLLALRNPPRIKVSVGPAVEGLTGESADADTKRIMKAIVAQLPAEARQKKVPTEEELRRTYPGGKIASTDEDGRRPGTD
jgi:putative phosphoserine phosphatase/1-acylglycerol-3-phosphate O-acyltransferase